MVSIDAKLNEFEPLKATPSDQKIKKGFRPYGLTSRKGDSGLTVLRVERGIQGLWSRKS